MATCDRGIGVRLPEGKCRPYIVSKGQPTNNHFYRRRRNGKYWLLLKMRLIYIFLLIVEDHYGPSSSVGIATDYGLDGPRSNPDGDEIFRPSRPAMGPTQPPVQWVPGLSRK